MMQNFVQKSGLVGGHLFNFLANINSQDHYKESLCGMTIVVEDPTLGEHPYMHLCKGDI